MNETLKNIFEKNFYTLKGLFVGILLILLTIILPIDNFLEKGVSTFKIRCIIYLVILFVWSIVWLCLREYLPKNSEGKIGLLLAIITENNKQKARIKDDLMFGINKLLKEHSLHETVTVMTLEDFKAIKVTSILQKYILKREEFNSTSAIPSNEVDEKFMKTREYKKLVKLTRKANCHFYLWGNIKERKDIQNNYYFHLDALVIHKPLSKEPATMLKREFSYILPHEITFPELLEVKGFELASNLIFIASMYITGLVAALSGDASTALKLHYTLQQELNKFRPLPPNLVIVSKNLRNFIILELLKRARELFNKKEAIKVKKLLDEAEALDNENYDVLVFISLFEFDIERDIKKALEYLKKASEVHTIDYTWLYNRAFIFMYIEEYEKGLNDYKRLKQITFPNEFRIIDECIDYNKNLYESELEKYPLLFNIGYLYYYKKNDLEKALYYFELFKGKACSNEKYSYLCTRVETYVNEIKNKLSK